MTGEVITDVASIRGRIDGLMPGVRADLERLVRIPSVSAEGYDPVNVRRSAEATAEIFDGSGMSTRILEVDGAHPAVLGTAPGPPGAPRVLLYAHHDVQPTGPEHLWHSKPFQPVERDGMMFGRGTSDDKAGIMAHAAAVRAWDGRPPVGVTVFVEGEEESASEHLEEFLSTYRDDLGADAAVLADCSNMRAGWPALTTSLRGIVDCVVEVRTLDHAVHSGMFGGPLPDALTVLCRTLATLHDGRGSVAIPGLASGPADPLDLTEEELRRDAGARPSVQLIGEGNLTERLWMRPAVSILGIDAPSIREATNQLVPSARAKVSMRLAPGDDAERALEALVEHLERNVPWGAEVTITRGSWGRPFAVRAEGPAYDAARRAFADAWERPPVDIGAGGSIPFVAAFADAFPDTALLLTGVDDPTCNAHSEDENLNLAEFERVCLAEALFLAYFADAAPAATSERSRRTGA
jgi:acetylornithine deacetylase/succinyl-diaminopimelate desuccinylase-like protein